MHYRLPPDKISPNEDEGIDEITSRRWKIAAVDPFLTKLLQRYSREQEEAIKNIRHSQGSHEGNDRRNSLPVDISKENTLRSKDSIRNTLDKRKGTNNEIIALKSKDSNELVYQHDVSTDIEMKMLSSRKSLNSDNVLIEVKDKPLLQWDYTRAAYFPWKTTPDSCSNYAIR